MTIRAAALHARQHFRTIGGRRGIVLKHRPDRVDVVLDRPVEVRTLHPRVLVLVTR